MPRSCIAKAALATALLVAAIGCRRGARPAERVASPPPTPVVLTETDAAGAPPEPEDRAYRERLVSELVASGYLHDARVIAAMREVPRHLFVPTASVADAYEDRPLPIGEGQTISQPAVVAWMTEALQVKPTDRVLEIGTGSGYQAAILAELGAQVFTIEIVPELGTSARERLSQLGYANVHVRIGDGYLGWPEEAPFDRVLVTAAPDEVPPALIEQLADHGVLVAPVGESGAPQRLVRVRKSGAKLQREELGAVYFVPMVPAN